MEYDQQKIDDAILAILSRYQFDNGRFWKGYPFSVLDRLHQQGYISDPVNKNKSAYLIPEGEAKARQVLAQLDWEK